MQKILILLLGCWCFYCARGSDTLQVAVYDNRPLGYMAENGRYEGLMLDLWREIADELHYTYRLQPDDMEGIMQGLQQGRYDVGLGAISITPEREKWVDFSQAVNPSGTGLAVLQGQFSDGFSTYALPILISFLRLLASITGFLVFAGVLIWLLERRRNPEHFRKDWRGILDGLWWSAVTMTTVGYGDKVPQSIAGRILAMSWIFVGVVLIALFTANASSIFLHTRQRTTLERVEDLYHTKVGSVANSSGGEYLDRQKVPYRAYDNIDAALEALLNGEIKVLVYNTPVLRYYQHHVYPEQILVGPKQLMKNNMGIALQPGSPYREEIDRVLLRRVAEEEWQQVIYRYFGADLP